MHIIIHSLLLFMCIFCSSFPFSVSESISSLSSIKNLAKYLTTRGADICSQNHYADIDLLIVSNSAAHNTEDRDRTRITWLNHWKVKEKKAIRVVFFVSKPKDIKQMETLALENEIHNDIVWTDTDDSDFYLTVKAVSWLKWVMKRCSNAKFILKIEENVIVNLPAVVQLINKNKRMTNTILGSVLHDGIWKWFERLFHPDYCSKSAYLMTRDVVKKLYVGALKPLPYNANEHIYLTGHVALKEGIHVIDDHAFKEMDLPVKSIIPRSTSINCKSLRNNIIFRTSNKKKEWTGHWLYLVWALKQCTPKDNSYSVYE